MCNNFYTGDKDRRRSGICLSLLEISELIAMINCCEMFHHDALAVTVLTQLLDHSLHPIMTSNSLPHFGLLSGFPLKCSRFRQVMAYIGSVLSGDWVPEISSREPCKWSRVESSHRCIRCNIWEGRLKSPERRRDPCRRSLRVQGCIGQAVL